MREFEKLVQERIAATGGRTHLLLLAPMLSDMPAPMHFIDDPFFPFSRDIIKATRDLVVGYVFDFPAYLRLGAAGATALERSIAYAGQDVVRVLHGTFATTDYKAVAFEAGFGANSVTIAHLEDLDVFTGNPAHGGFWVVPDNLVTIPPVPRYNVKEQLFTLQSGIQLILAGKNVLYASYGEDFADACRVRLAEMGRQ